MGAGHDHGGAAARAGEKHRGRLWAAFLLLAVFMVVEAVAAWTTGSLALLSDAGHMFTDVLGIGMALAAITAARRAAADPQRTFGLYRLEVLAALANAVLLFGVAIYVLVEAIRRLAETAPEIKTTPMLIVAGAGLVANIVAFAAAARWRRGEHQRPRRLPRGARRPRSARSGSSSRRSSSRPPTGGGSTPWSPSRSACSSCRARTSWAARPSASWCRRRPSTSTSPPSNGGWPPSTGVRDVHDLHVWTLTSGMEVASAHLGVDPADGSGGRADHGAHGAARRLRHRPRDAAGRAARAHEGLRTGRLVRG